jgi:hypothetical protein
MDKVVIKIAFYTGKTDTDGEHLLSTHRATFDVEFGDDFPDRREEYLDWVLDNKCQEVADRLGKRFEDMVEAEAYYNDEPISHIDGPAIRRVSSKMN